MIDAGTQTIWQAFAATAGRYPDRAMFNVLQETADIYGIPAGELSYRQVQTQVTELAAVLQQKGYGPGYRVMLLLENRPEFFVWLLALKVADATAVFAQEPTGYEVLDEPLGPFRSRFNSDGEVIRAVLVVGAVAEFSLVAASRPVAGRGAIRLKNPRAG